MRKFFAQPLFLFAVFAAFVISGCGSGSRPISVSLSPSSAQTIDQGQTLSITASVANDSASKGVTWAVNGGGTLSNQTATAATYNAPASVTSAFTATVTATSAADTTKSAMLSIKVNPPPSITTTSLPNGTAGMAYNQTLVAAGGTGSLTWSISAGALPNGLSLSSSTGAITGTPTGAGASNFTVQVKDSANLTATHALSITVTAAAALTITTTSLPNGTTGTVYSQTVQATGGVQPYTWSVTVGALPAGLSLNASTGAITGTPTAAGTSAFTVQVTDSQTPTHATATQPLSIIINAQPLAITTTSLPSGAVSAAYSATLQASGGVTPYTWSVTVGTLPAGLSLNASTGAITGTPTATGTSNFTVQVADSETIPATQTQALSITVNPAGANNSQLKGQYAFLVQGFDSAMAVSFTADGSGNITAGVEDVQAPGASLEGKFTITSGTYSIGSDERGTLSFTDSNSKTYSFAVALGSISSGIASKGQMIETDAQFEASGSLALQKSSAFSTTSITGSYAFGFPGWDASRKPQVIIGSFSAATGTIANGLFDQNDNGVVAGTTSVVFSGSYGSIDTTTGRGSLSVTANGSTTNLAFYIISAGQWFAIQSGTTNTDVLSGQVLQQTGAPFSTSSSLTGNVIFEDQSQDGNPPTNGGPNAVLGVITLNGSSAVSFSLDNDQDGTINTLSGSGTVAFDVGANGTANGRFTVTPSGTNPSIGYMIAPNQAFLTNVNTGKTPDFGTFEPQASGPFTQTSVSGAFFLGTLPIVSVPTNSNPLKVQSGVITFSNPNITGTSDTNSNGTVSSGAITDTYTVASNGRVTTGSLVAYIVSGSKIYVMDLKASATPTNPTIKVLQQ